MHKPTYLDWALADVERMRDHGDSIQEIANKLKITEIEVAYIIRRIQNN